MDDWQQLREYLENGTEGAFAALVTRHLGLVYSVALRILGNSEDAQEVAQSVFCDLARKARKLRPDTVIAGWLHQAAWFAALDYRRTEHRRRRREQQAATMATTDPHPENAWHQVAPHLDEALTQMDDRDRLGILLRFYQGKSFRQVGETLGVNDDAARMRVNRAIEKLHALLRQKNVACSLAALGAVLADHAVQAAPFEAAQSVVDAWSRGFQASSAPMASFKSANLIARLTLKNAIIFGVALMVAIDAGLIVLNRVQERSTPGNPLPLPMPSPRLAAQPSVGGLRQATKPQERSPDLEPALANLRRVLREKPLDENGGLTHEKVFTALKAFGADADAAIPVLLEGLRTPEGPNDMIQWSSAVGFLFLGERAAAGLPSLIELIQLDTASRDARLAAMQSLRYMIDGPTPADGTGLAAAVPALMGLLTGADAELVRSAVATLSTIGDPAQGAIPAIAELLVSGDARTVQSATAALGAFGDSAKQAIPAMVQLLDYSPPSQPAEAEPQPLPGASREAGAKGLEKARQRLANEVRKGAAKALELMGSEAVAAVPALIQKLADADKDVRGRFAVALWKIAGRTDGVAVMAANIWPPKYPGSSDSADWEDQLNALAEMGPAAKVAVPNLLRLCRHQQTPPIAPRALEILRDIDPETAAKVGL